jgi:hypothetical protein
VSFIFPPYRANPSNRIGKAAQEESFEALEPSFVRLGFHQARLQFDR